MSPVEIHMQGACEQQETQQSVHQRLIEIDLTDEALDCGTDLHGGMICSMTTR